MTCGETDCRKRKVIDTAGEDEPSQEKTRDTKQNLAKTSPNNSHEPTHFKTSVLQWLLVSDPFVAVWGS